MKHFFLLAALVLGISTNSHAVINMRWQKMAQTDENLQSLPPEALQMGLANFMTLTPNKYKEMTGERLGLVKSVKLKMAQRYVKKNLMDDAGISSGLYILLAILGLAWVAMGIMDDWEGSNWIINLILVWLCWLPGLIHALAKRSEYY